MTRRVIIGVLVLLLVGAGIYLFLLRSPVEAPSTAMTTVTIECDAWTGVTTNDCGRGEIGCSRPDRRPGRSTWRTSRA
jgi:hypothetical protein